MTKRGKEVKEMTRNLYFKKNYANIGSLQMRRIDEGRNVTDKC